MTNNKYWKRFPCLHHWDLSSSKEPSTVTVWTVPRDTVSQQWCVWEGASSTSCGYTTARGHWAMASCGFLTWSAERSSYVVLARNTSSVSCSLYFKGLVSSLSSWLWAPMGHWSRLTSTLKCRSLHLKQHGTKEHLLTDRSRIAALFPSRDSFSGTDV